MKSFVFKYQRVLKQREDEEEDVKTKLGEVNFELQQLLAQKNQILSQQRTFMDDVQTRLSGGVRTSELQMFEQSKYHFKSKLENLEAKIAEVRLRIVQIKKELTEAVKQRKIMEKLKEKELEAYTEALNASERKVIEEIVNYRSSQKSGDS